MKFNRLMITGVLCVASIGAFAWVSKSEAVSVDKNLAIKTFIGEPSMLEDMKVENVLKISSNKFEKVTFSKDKVHFEPTKYDEKYSIGEDVLENLDVFRGHHNGPSLTTKENQLVMLEFNTQFPYASHEPTVEIRIKDMNTGKVKKENRRINDVGMNSHILSQNLCEIQGEVYYVLYTQDINGDMQYPAFIYHVNVKNGTLTLVQELAFDPNSIIGSDEKYLYCLGYLTDTATADLVDDTETAQTIDRKKELQLHTIDITTKKVTSQKMPSISEQGINKFILADHSMIVSCYTENGLKYYVIDRKTLKVTDTFQLSNKKQENVGYGVGDWAYQDGKLYFLEIEHNSFFDKKVNIGVYDLNKKEIVYNGELPSQPIANYKWVQS